MPLGLGTHWLQLQARVPPRAVALLKPHQLRVRQTVGGDHVWQAVEELERLLNLEQGGEWSFVLGQLVQPVVFTVGHINNR